MKDGTKVMKNQRTVYAVVFGVLLLTEICIALFIHDNFIRPYIGDLLVTALLCCFCRMIVPNKVRVLPAYVFLFAALVELAQYFDIVKILGLEDCKLISTVIGRTFSLADIICYGGGCLAFWAIERAVKGYLTNRRSKGVQ